MVAVAAIIMLTIGLFSLLGGTVEAGAGSLLFLSFLVAFIIVYEIMKKRLAAFRPAKPDIRPGDWKLFLYLLIAFFFVQFFWAGLAGFLPGQTVPF